MKKSTKQNIAKYAESIKSLDKHDCMGIVWFLSGYMQSAAENSGKLNIDEVTEVLADEAKRRVNKNKEAQ